MLNTDPSPFNPTITLISVFTNPCHETKAMTEILHINDIVFRDDLYPRIKTDHLTVQKYAEDLSVLPPIEVNQYNELIDGWHRWTAHKKVNGQTIEIRRTQTQSESHFLQLAIERNAKHGLQLSQEDKRDMARRIYHTTPERDRQKKKKELAIILSVDERSVRGWLARIDKDTKVKRDRQIFDLWMACYTQEEIAQRLECDRNEVKRLITDFGQNGKLSVLTKVNQHAADYSIDIFKPKGSDKLEFTPPQYNVWKLHEKSEGSKHYGNTEPVIVDRLLYLYTQPFDVVIDPFAGGGSTMDVCKKRFRRYFVSDRKPIPEREKDIRQWDIAEGLPKVPRWKEVKLVYLDPPYWHQAQGKYSDDAEDLANMPLDQFYKTLIDFIHAVAKKLTDAHIALIIQPTQWKAPDKQYIDHAADLMCKVNLPLAMRIQTPYESQQSNAQMNQWAQDNKQLLVISREIIVWRT